MLVLIPLLAVNWKASIIKIVVLLSSWSGWYENAAWSFFYIQMCLVWSCPLIKNRKPSYIVYIEKWYKARFISHVPKTAGSLIVYYITGNVRNSWRFICRRVGQTKNREDVLTRDIIQKIKKHVNDRKCEGTRKCANSRFLRVAFKKREREGKPNVRICKKSGNFE